MLKYLFFLFLALNSFRAYSQGSGNTVVFDGTNDAADGNASDLSTIYDNFTIEMWIKPTTTITVKAQQNGISDISGTTGNGQRYAVFPTHGGSSCGVVGNAGAGISAGTNCIQVYEHSGCYMPALLSYSGTFTGWTHIAVVYTSKQPKLYVNGMNVATGLTSNQTHVFPGALLGGAAYGWFQGSLDEVRIWDHSRSQNQIRTYMCQSLTGSESGLMRYYRFDASSGTTLTDISGNHHATLTNMIANPWITSGAPIGNTSTFRYGTSWGSGFIRYLSSSEGDSLSVSSVSGTVLPDGIHIYHVDAVPNTTSGIPGLGGNDHYYGVFKAGGTNVTYTAIYYYRENDSYQLSSAANDPSYSESGLVMYKRTDNAATSWSNTGFSPNTTTKTITATGMSTEYILALNGGAELPVELLDFTGSYLAGKTYLYWTTASEKNNHYFTVERSLDGEHFETIAQLPGAGNSVVDLNYNYTDDAPPLAEVIYYRLRQTDYDGTSQSCVPVAVYPDAAGETKIFPQPVSAGEQVNMLLKPVFHDFLVLEMVNLQGEILLERQYYQDDFNSLRFMVPQFLSSGLYLLKLSDASNSITVKLIVE